MRKPRDLLKGVVRELPVSLQVALKALRAHIGGPYDSAPEVSRVWRREREVLEASAHAASQQPGRKRILVFAIQQSPPWLEMSCGLALALRLRGHHVRGLRCDGGVPLCELNLGGIERPRCDVCSAWLRRYPEALGFDFTPLGTYARTGDEDDARSIVLAAEAEDPELKQLLSNGVDLAPFARRELRRFRRGYVFDPARDEAYVPWLVSGVILLGRIGRCLDAERPDIVLQSSGRTLVAECVAAAARARGIRVVSWDTEPSFPDGLVFSHDRPAVEIPLDEAWKEAAHQPLTEGEREQLHAFLLRWSRSDGTPFPYNPTPLNDAAAIRTALGLHEGRRVIAAFANSAWDMAAVDRDVGFSSMFDWLFALVDYAKTRPDLDIVVRAHPAEVKVSPDLMSRTPVAATLRAQYPALPPNVKLVDGGSPLSSYVLADIADVVMVYATRFGLELAVKGRRPWVAGEVTYRGKGFTRDVASPEDMTLAIDAGRRSDNLSASERDLAERFAHLWFSRYVTRLPLVRRPDGRFRVDSFGEFLVGADGVLGRLCDAIVTGEPFLDLGAPLSQPDVLDY